MDNVIRFPGTEDKWTVEDALHEASDLELTDVIIVGRRENGSYTVSISSEDPTQMMFGLEWAKHRILTQIEEE